MQLWVGQVLGCSKRIFLLAVALTPLGSSASEVGNAVRAQTDGVTLDIRSLPDRVVFCIRAREDIKISSRYGVTFDADREDVDAWDENLPKTIEGPDWDFDLPLRVDIKTRPLAGERRIRIQLGACSDHCDLVKFNIRVPSYRNEVVAEVTCSK
jgi:hypothetical protein